MELRPILVSLVIALICALPGKGVAQDKLSMSGLDPALLGALEGALTPETLAKLGYDSFESARRTALVSVAATDCPDSCNTDLDRGMCLCKPEADGSCPAKAASIARGGARLCRALPFTITIFASEGGLGTTRIDL